MQIVMQLHKQRREGKTKAVCIFPPCAACSLRKSDVIGEGGLWFLG